MSFDSLVSTDGLGRVILADFSYDDFATRTRYGDKAGVYEGSTGRSNRIVSLSTVRRGLGQNRVATGSSCELVMDNSDGALDSLTGRDNMRNLAKLRVRLSIAIYVPGVDPLSFEEKLFGFFSLTEWPRQNNTTISLQLGDDILGALGQQAALPTIWDWHITGSTTDNPIFTSYGLPDSIDAYTPVQLAFGEDWVRCMPHIIPYNAPNEEYRQHLIIPVCCTTDTGAGSTDDVTSLRAQVLMTGGKTKMFDVPLVGFGATPSAYGIEQENWYCERSPTISKNGKSFKVIYVVIRRDVMQTFWARTTSQIGGTASPSEFRLVGGYPVQCVDWLDQPRLDERPPGSGSLYNEYGGTGSRVVAWYAKGLPLSARTQTTSTQQHPIDVIKDLVGYYSDQTSTTIDTTAADRVRASNPNAACVVVVQPWTDKANNEQLQLQPPSLRQVITGICQSGDFDCFINWDGEFSFSSDVRDYTIATQSPTLVEFHDTQMSDVERWIPSSGERHAPYNRLYFRGAKYYAAEEKDVPFQGPFEWDDAGGTSIPTANRVVEATLEQGYRPWRQQAQRPIDWRNLEVEARDKMRFRTNIRGLLLELGQFFKLTWSRGGAGAVYDADVFQCESIAYAPGDDSVEVEAIWRDDVATTQIYLLDDETLLVRSKGALTGNATPVDGTTTCDFGGTINLTTMGVAVGDILVLRCTTDAEDDFEGNAAFRIATIPSTTQITVAVAFGTLDTNPIPNAEWYICRGATTYPTAVSDPTNYPDGGTMYGKATDDAGLDSASADGNALYNG